MKKHLLLLIASMAFLLACRNSEPQEQPKEIRKDSMPAQAGAQADLSKLVLFQPTDPECGMSLEHSIADTATVDGKLYGFCSDYCKKSYLEAHQAVKK